MPFFDALNVTTTGISIVYVLLIVAAVNLACVITARVALRRLKKLMQAIREIARGNYAYRIEVDGKGEIASLEKAFNAMSRSIEKNVKRMSKRIEIQSGFIPHEMLLLLGKRSLQGVKPGDNTSVSCSTVSLFTTSFESSAEPKLFAKLNRYLGLVMPFIFSAGGAVERFTERELTAHLLQPPLTAVNAAISLMRALRDTKALDELTDGDIDSPQIQDEHSLGDDEPPLLQGEHNLDNNELLRLPSPRNHHHRTLVNSCYAVISHGRTRVGVIGMPRKMCFTSISESFDQTVLPPDLGSALNCRILLTAEAYEYDDSAFDGSDIRYIGLVKDAGDRGYYEVFSADSQAVRNAKLNTLTLFNAAVTSYYSSHYHKARRLFIDVIKQSPDDLVTSQYLQKSDYLMRHGGEPIPLDADE